MRLVNLGATCYINTLLQCLKGCPDFFQTIERNGPGTIGYDVFFSDSNVSLRINLRKFIDHFSDDMNVYSQNDIAEFFCLVVDKINSECPGTLSRSHVNRK
jgi:ubiquitin C-terminal hydrolase